MANEEEKKDYRIITRDIAGKLNLDETYTFTWLLFKSDYETGESHVLRETLREVTGIKDVDTISKYTAKFEALGFLRKEYNYRSNEGQLTTPVTYHVDILHIPADTRSAFPVISVQSPVSIQCCWQS